MSRTFTKALVSGKFIYFRFQRFFKEVDLKILGDLECEGVMEREWLKMTLRSWFEWLEIKFWFEILTDK